MDGMIKTFFYSFWSLIYIKIDFLFLILKIIYSGTSIMDSLQQLSLYELEMILENAFYANDIQTVEMIMERLDKLCLEQQENQPSKKKRRQTRRISITASQPLTPILESPLE